MSGDRLGDHVELPSVDELFPDGPTVLIKPDATLESIDQRLVMTNIMLDRVNHNLEKVIDIMEEFMEREW